MVKVFLIALAGLFMSSADRPINSSLEKCATVKDGVHEVLEYVDGIMVKCSYQFSSGPVSCYSEGATCAQAYELFAECACENNHPIFCKNDGGGQAQ
ncbi:MAG: hypothetical protein LC107_02920 [Chitinophagales bacterium]|nr:hypothetical protein [Chitinophagales bacterium]